MRSQATAPTRGPAVYDHPLGRVGIAANAPSRDERPAAAGAYDPARLEPHLRRGRGEQGLAVQRALRGVVAAVVRWRARRAALRELRSLTDRQLRDIGVNRADIPGLVESLAEQMAERTVGTKTGQESVPEPRAPRPLPTPNNENRPQRVRATAGTANTIALRCG